MRLSYDELVHQYLETLNAKLRNFSVEPEFLATWVHDEDDHRSLCELFVAAQAGGCRELTIDVSAGTAAKLDSGRLTKELSALGEADLAPRAGGGLEISVRLKEKLEFAAGAAPVARRAAPPQAPSKGGARRRESRPGEFDEIYRRAVAERRMSFEGRLFPSPAAELFSVEEDGAVLEASVAADGVVLEARHSGAKPPLRQLLDVMCEIMQGRPLQEAHDHAVIRVEARLRDRAAAAPVAGLLTPANVDPIFAAPQRLVRALYWQYSVKTGRKPQANFWDDSAAAAWKALLPQEKLARARAAMAGACRELGLDEKGVEVLEILGDVRFVLANTPVAATPDFAAAMMRLEGLVKKAVDPRIELQLESLEDRNRRTERTARGDKQL